MSFLCVLCLPCFDNNMCTGVKIWQWSGKKSKSVFDFLTYSRETGFSFSYGKVGHLHRPIEASHEIDRVNKFDNSLPFSTKQNALRQIFFALWFFEDLFTKNLNRIFFQFYFILFRINKGVYLSLFEHANTRKHVYEHSCSSVRVILSISAHSAHLAQSFFSGFKGNKWANVLIDV